jgi:hypothetical protein
MPQPQFGLQSYNSWKGGALLRRCHCPLLLLLLTLLLYPDTNVPPAAAARLLLPELGNAIMGLSGSGHFKSNLPGLLSGPQASPSPSPSLRFGNHDSEWMASSDASRQPSWPGQTTLPSGIISDPQDSPQEAGAEQADFGKPQPDSGGTPSDMNMPAQHVPRFNETAAGVADPIKHDYQRASAAEKAPGGVVATAVNPVINTHFAPGGGAANNGGAVTSGGSQQSSSDQRKSDFDVPLPLPTSDGSDSGTSGSGGQSGDSNPIVDQRVDVCACKLLDERPFGSEAERRDACVKVPGCHYLPPRTEPWQTGQPTGNCTGHLC